MSKTKGGPVVAGVVLILLFIVGGVCALGALSSVDTSAVTSTMEPLTNTTQDLAHFSLNVWTVLPVVVIAGAVFAALWALAIKGRRRR